MKSFNKILIATALLLCISSGLSAIEAYQDTQPKWMLRVIVQVANVRSGPGLDQAVVRQMTQDTLLTAMEKQGEWYRVMAPASADLPEIEAFIHQSTVDIVNTFDEERKTPGELSQPDVSQPLRKEPESVRGRPEPKPSPQGSLKKMYLAAGFHAGMQEENSIHAWTETIYHEDASASLEYQVQTGTPITASLGYRFSPSIGVEIGADISSRNMTENYSASIPHPLYFSVFREAEGTQTESLTENTLFINLVYSLRFGSLGLDVFGGPAYIMAETSVVSAVNFSESYPYDTISLNADTAEIAQNVFGFNGGAELVFYLGESFAIHGGARYISGQAVFEPESGIPGPEITLGGLRAGGGIKIFF